MQQRLPLLLFLLLLVGFRVLGAVWPELFPNFQPLTAVFFCAAAWFSGRLLWLPALAWLVTLPLTNGLQGYGWSLDVVVALVGIGLTVLVGRAFREHRGLGPMLAGAALCTLGAYVVMNTLSWLTLPDYPRTWAGFVQAQWTGAPHHALPTWIFLRNPLLANLLFTALFVLGQRRLAVPSGVPARRVPAGG